MLPYSSAALIEGAPLPAHFGRKQSERVGNLSSGRGDLFAPTAFRRD